MSTIDPNTDPAQAEWEAESSADHPPVEELQPETQGESPVEAEVGEDGQGDVLPEDL